MSENLIIAIIGVISSVSVFFMTMIANIVAYKNRVRQEIKREITEELTKIISKIIDTIPMVKSDLTDLTNECSICIKEKIDIQYNVDIKEKELQLAERSVELIGAFINFQAYIKSHILPLNKYLIYHDKLKELALLFKDKYQDYTSVIDENQNKDIVILTQKGSSVKLVLDEIYFHLYNLYIDIQNDTYSKFFKKYKMKKNKDPRFKVLNIKL